MTHAVRLLLQERAGHVRDVALACLRRYRGFLSRQGLHTSETPPLACPLQSSQSVRALPSITRDL